MRTFPLLVLAALVALASLGTSAGAIVTPTYTIHPGLNGLANSGEPSIGADWVTGATLVQSGSNTLRVTFDDSVTPAKATWTKVNPVAIPNLDPILFTDSKTGHTLAGGDLAACSSLLITDDDGASWLPAANPCAPPAFDHETIGGGPAHAPLDAAVSSVYYYCVDEAVQECATSLDGGLTFGAPEPLGTSCTGLLGHVKVAPDGTAFIPTNGCVEGVGLWYTLNNGITWAHHPVGSFIGGGHSAAGFDASVGIGSTRGWLYVGWEDAATHHQLVSMSKDAATHWSAPVDLSALGGLGATSFSAVTAGDDDRAAVAFLGSTTQGNGHDSKFTGTFDLYVATTLDAGATWTIVKATSDPVQRGYICDGGLGCSGGRNLLDFIDATVDAQGHVQVVFADGCTTSVCKGPSGTSANSVNDLDTIARQNGGACLIAAKC